MTPINHAADAEQFAEHINDAAHHAIRAYRRDFPELGADANFELTLADLGGGHMRCCLSLLVGFNEQFFCEDSVLHEAEYQRGQFWRHLETQLAERRRARAMGGE